ncbi:hypothetical protein RUE5091_01824 [Ruegeria denitrificans]|uniref:Uncharacterized protein n=1 Tax=Ruegeria denitrificans TaxID=1715692 RepID=A0A0P1I8L8_9RHOB|nr:hypothetical protein RUE5091_01824 [Ruegeria denitrificans]
MDQPLTALERDLLACVEQLVTACETSASELRNLEERSTTGIEARLNGLTQCIELLMKSHLKSVATLADLLTEEQNYTTLEENLQTSLKLARAAETLLQES